MVKGGRRLALEPIFILRVEFAVRLLLAVKLLCRRRPFGVGCQLLHRLVARAQDLGGVVLRVGLNLTGGEQVVAELRAQLCRHVDRPVLPAERATRGALVAGVAVGGAEVEPAHQLIARSDPDVVPQRRAANDLPLEGAWRRQAPPRGALVERHLRPRRTGVALNHPEGDRFAQVLKRHGIGDAVHLEAAVHQKAVLQRLQRGDRLVDGLADPVRRLVLGERDLLGAVLRRVEV
mmetsp:Transcript_84/g.251  ORF Transcript_84/g.251 Transcript_84/m.251 type:complete len:234 (+) Transcript_84:218-919(+)